MFVNNYFSATKSAKSCRIFLVVVFLMFVAAKTAAANEGDFYIVYEFNDVVRTPSDHRERYTQVRVYKSGDVAFRDRDEIFGCTDKIVHEMNLFNEDAAKITKEEVAYLKEALVEAKVFDLVSDPMPPGFFDVRPMQEPAHYANLEVNIDGREKRFEFYTNPRSFDRAAVHKVMFDFVTRLKLDQPPSDSRAIIVSEGDLEPSQSVQLAEVLSNPEEYHGKRLIDWFADLPRGNTRLGAAGKILTGAHVREAMAAGLDFVIIGRGAILHHDFPKRFAISEAFEPVPLPVSEQHLRDEGLGDAFIKYMGTWKGFVQGPAA